MSGPRAQVVDDPPSRFSSRFPASWLDAAILIALTAVTAAPYLAGLGFYSDDHLLVEKLMREAERSGSAFSAVAEYSARPLHGALLAFDYTLFGRSPTGYHLIGTALIAAAIAAFFQLLLRLGIGRRDAFAAAAILIVLPQLSTIRAWPAAHQIQLSMLLMLLFAHAFLSFLDKRRPLFALAAALAAIGSLAAYETFAPLILGFALAALVARHRDKLRDRRHWPKALAAGLGIGLFALAALAFKLLSSSRGDAIFEFDRYIAGAVQLVRVDYDWRVDSSLNVFAAASAHFGQVVRGWAKAAADLLLRPDAALGAAAIASGLIVWLRLQAADASEPQAARIGTIFWLGLSAFILGHATYLLVPAIVFTSTGAGNRALVSAAPGAALLYVALLLTLVRLLPPAARSASFAALVALISLCGTARTVAIEYHWVEAASAQRLILARARSELAQLPAGSTVILDGVCPYRGPGIVFEFWWDWGPALSNVLGRPVAGDVVSPRTFIDRRGVHNSLYEEPRTYKFSDRLYVYRPGRAPVRLTSLNDAAAYFGRTERDFRCPVSYPARGVPI